MKRVGILTYHRVFNYGSLLQTYALQEYLKKLKCEVEVIDYYPERLQKKNLLFHVNPKWSTPFWKRLVHLTPAVITRLLGYRMMDKFLKKYIQLTPCKYMSIEELINHLPDKDIYMNGSDQIWNVDNSDGQVDRVFFMDFLPESAIRAAYAGSFGKDSFSEEILKEIKKYLTNYKSISVREKSGLNILSEIGISNGEWLLDPTLLLKREEWEKVSIEILLPEHYILVYNLNRNTRITKLAKKIADERSLKIVNFAHSFIFINGAKNVVYPTPNTFITMFAKADYIVTDSFHGTAFSINFERQFICIPAPKYNSRLESILELVGLNERLLYGEDDFSVINKKVDYNTIGMIIEHERLKADLFIKKIINE